jgi:hypothetical protein
VRVSVNSREFSVVVDGRPPKRFANPLVNPTPRLYLGNGFEVDYLPTNSGSEFLVALASVSTAVKPAGESK